jgi:hypothetical protein
MVWLLFPAYFFYYSVYLYLDVSVLLILMGKQVNICTFIKTMDCWV